MKMSNKSFFKTVIFWFVKKTSDCALTKSVRTISNLDNCRNKKKNKLKVENKKSPIKFSIHKLKDLSKLINIT